MQSCFSPWERLQVRCGKNMAWFKSQVSRVEMVERSIRSISMFFPSCQFQESRCFRCQQKAQFEAELCVTLTSMQYIPMILWYFRDIPIISIKFIKIPSTPPFRLANFRIVVAGEIPILRTETRLSRQRATPRPCLLVGDVGSDGKALVLRRVPRMMIFSWGYNG